MSVLTVIVVVVVVKTAAVVFDSNKCFRLTTFVLQLTSVDVLPTVVAAEQLERTQIHRLIRLAIQTDGIVISVLRLKADLGRLAQALRALPIQSAGTAIGKLTCSIENQRVRQVTRIDERFRVRVAHRREARAMLLTTHAVWLGRHHADLLVGEATGDERTVVHAFAEVVDGQGVRVQLFGTQGEKDFADVGVGDAVFEADRTRVI